jgi:hypothetical protein
MCDCGCESVLIEKNEECREINISLWIRGYSIFGLDLKYKFKLTWRILTQGYPYTDQICLSYEKAQKLGKYLQELAI